MSGRVVKGEMRVDWMKMLGGGANPCVVKINGAVVPNTIRSFAFISARPPDSFPAYDPMAPPPDKKEA